MMAVPEALRGLRCYGLDLSYFTGKVEAFLRYQEIPHERVELNLARFRHVARQTGLAQMPALELADGRWMSDSTPIIEWIDAAMGPPCVMPADPVQRFASQMLEDYADEWLWRPALHYRWSFAPDARLMSHRIASEMLTDLPLPLALRRQFILRRQISKYVTGDGITHQNRAHVEDIYLRNLAWLQAIFAVRPFLLGNRPTLADFGFFASMFRHFSLDPTPARLMRDRAPAVFEWVARLWNARRTELGGERLRGGIPPDWHPFLRDAAACYLPYLHANAAAWRARQRRFTVMIEGVPYRLPVHRYRVWCLERLQKLHLEASDFTETGLTAALFAAPAPRSGFDPESQSPFFKPPAWSPK